MDVDHNVLEVNGAFCRMLGYTREEAMRLNVRDWNGQFSAEELRARFRSPDGVIAAKRPVCCFGLIMGQKYEQ